MKTLRISLIGLLLSLLGIYILAAASENGDKNAISMYFIVFLYPTITIVLINGFYLFLLNNLTNKTAKILLSLVPVAILVLLTLKKELVIKGIDGNLVFVTIVTAISLAITNLIWIISVVKAKVR